MVGDIGRNAVMADSWRGNGGSAWLDAVLYDQDEPLTQVLDLDPVQMRGQIERRHDNREQPTQ
jgi:hypothetical protein